jgi:hypothetical protein
MLKEDRIKLQHVFGQPKPITLEDTILINSSNKCNKCAHLIGLRGLKYYEKGLYA